jgi:endonuclease-3
MTGRLKPILEALRHFYGQPPEPAVTKPFEQVLWDNVAYMADDERRSQAFRVLKEGVGTRPEAILAAPQDKLLEAAGYGILAATFAGKLRSAAAIAMELGDLESLVGVPVAQARRVLQRFPGIGEPGADRILLFSRMHAVPVLESNGSRALQRLLSVSAGGSYAQVYRAATALIAAELGPDFDRLIETYQLLRRHGQELCRRSLPLCEPCPLRDGCAYYVGQRRRPSGSLS